ncbi:hypothetical protein HMPREF0004_3623 [Achromobacter piechaudii ATCC 43553]|uniref:Uncharacterized protein n=1 Tax=Achromobacter piechaudii ATCC 43553 TaxID=742159 RepID=D4XDS6_9BURK|nr:hypothetical protein HMPREF0004_3623 [Achromobacter piechaudii ATCC 43553]
MSPAVSEPRHRPQSRARRSSARIPRTQRGETQEIFIPPHRNIRLDACRPGRCNGETAKKCNAWIHSAGEKHESFVEPIPDPGVTSSAAPRTRSSRLIT